MASLPLVLLALLAVVNLFVGAFLLWVTCKICRVRRASAAEDVSPRIGIRFRRAFAVVFGVGLCGILAFVVFKTLVPERLEADLRLSILALVFNLGLLLVVLRLFVCPRLGRTILVALLFYVLSSLYATGFILVVNTALLHAYVVPTGGMAETLLGYHREVACPACGYEFAVNCSAEADPSEGRPMPTVACICPNCRQPIHFPIATSTYRVDHPDSVEVADPGIQGGDRFFTGRGLLGADRIVPRRFDIIIHDYPFRQSFTYIKRLIGLPGETIAITGGDLYVLPAGKGGQYDPAEAEQEVRDETEAKTLMHPDDPDAIRRFEQGQFEILRKSPELILALRRIVYDNDHPAKDQPPRWKGEEGWSANGNGFRSSAGSAERIAWLRYHHLVRAKGGKPALITDMLGYNTYQSTGHPPLLGDNWVGDLILECEVALDNPQGELRLELSRGVDRFQARWDLGTGTCTLLRVTKEGEQKLESKATALQKKGSYRLRFANVDKRLVVWVDDELPFESGVPYAPPQDLGPRPENDLEPARIGVRGAAVTLHKLKLFRDTYYTVGGIAKDRPNEPDVPLDPTDPETWRDLSRPPLLTLYVQPGHYFVLGDNSAESSDSRSWGLVPHRLLLGRAFFVYYPWKRVGPLR